MRGRRHRPRVHAGWKTGAIVPGEHARVTTSVFDLPTRDPARAGRRTAVQRCLARTRGGSASLAVVWQAANGIKGRIAPLSGALHGRKGHTPSPFVFSAAERRASRVRPVAAVAVLDRRLGPPMPHWGYQPFAESVNVTWNGQSDLLRARNVLWCGHCIGTTDGWCAGGVIGPGASVADISKPPAWTGASVRRCRPGVTSRSPNWRMSAGTDNPTCSLSGKSSGADTASAQRTAGRSEAASAPGCRVPRTPRHDARSSISQAWSSTCQAARRTA